MAGVASINIKFLADIAQFSTQMQNANRSIAKMGKKMQSMGTALSVGVTAPLTAFSVVSLKNWDTQVKAIAQVEAGLKSTGNAVGYTSAELQDMASELQNTSLFGDEDILKSVTAQLLTFTNIAGEQFNETQKATLNLATRMGGDLKGAALQLGKALNDPVTNLSALSRSGIQFSEDQKVMIKSLVQTNRLADAQTIILGELENQFGGSAAAAAKAGLGPFKQLSNSIGDLTEDFGAIIGKAILPFVDALKGMVSRFQALNPETKKFIVVISGLAAAVGPLLIALGFMMTTVIPGLTVAFTALAASVLKFTAFIAANPFGAIAVALAAVVSYFVFFNKTVDVAVKKQTLLSKITDTASKSIANEKAKLTELLAIARHEGVSKKQRLEAIREINKISPEFLGNLTLETINTDAAAKAVENYNNQLLQTAKVKAAQTKLQEIQAAKIDIELSEGKKLVKNAADLKKLKEEALTVEDRLKIKTLEKVGYGKVSNGIHSAQLKQLQDEEDLLLSIITHNKIKNTVTSSGGTDKKGNKKLTATKLEGVGASLNIANPIIAEGAKVDGALNGINSSLIDFSETASAIVSGAATNVLTGFGEMIGGLIAGNLTMGDVAGGLLTIIGNMATELGKAAIGIGVGMLAIKAAFKNPFTAIAAGVALVALGAVISSAASITSNGDYAGAYANGGMVAGSSYSGDKLFARVNSGEMILNKRQQSNLGNMISPAGQSVDISFTPGIGIKDREIVMYLEQAGKRVSRRK